MLCPEKVFALISCKNTCMYVHSRTFNDLCVQNSDKFRPSWLRDLSIRLNKTLSVAENFCKSNLVSCISGSAVRPLILLQHQSSDMIWIEICIITFERKEKHILFAPAYLSVSKDRGGHICPLSILGLVWVRIPILFGKDLPGSYLPYWDWFMKFGWPEPPPR